MLQADDVGAFEPPPVRAYKMTLMLDTGMEPLKAEVTVYCETLGEARMKLNKMLASLRLPPCEPESVDICTEFGRGDRVPEVSDVSRYWDNPRVIV